MQMHDFTLILAVVAIALLAYQSDLDDRPPAQDDEWIQGDGHNDA